MEIILFKSIKYQLDTEDKTAIVIGYQDDPVDVIIPEYVEYENEKYKVTKIAIYTFSNCYSLTSITIPNSVTFIGNNAFYYCISLETITIPDSVTYIGYEAFYNCKNLTSVTIGNSVTSIGVEAFCYCYSLTSITIGNSVTKIGDMAFYGCRNLTSITIPNSVTKIGDSAFYNCQSLTSITTPDSVKYIGNYAFQKCSSLTTITIPNSVTSIGILAFANCSSLSSITIPDSIKYIGDSAFYNLGMTLPKRYTEDGKLIAYKGFNADMTCRNFQYEEGKSYEIEEKIKCCNRGFHSCTNLLDVFNYYNGQISTDLVIHEVYLSGAIDDNSYDSKVCASKIEIGRRLTIKDINKIIKLKLFNKMIDNINLAEQIQFDFQLDSQICTTEEQSKRLLDLGLKIETADMKGYHYLGHEVCIGCTDFDDAFDAYPTWSLHRLICLCDVTTIAIPRDKLKDAYECQIFILETLIKTNQFDKEYLIDK